MSEKSKCDDIIASPVWNESNNQKILDYIRGHIDSIRCDGEYVKLLMRCVPGDNAGVYEYIITLKDVSKDDILDIFDEAFQSKSLKIVKTIMKKADEYMKERINEYFIEVVKMFNEELFDLFMSFDFIDPSRDNNIALRKASKYCDRYFVRKLLNNPDVITTHIDIRKIIHNTFIHHNPGILREILSRPDIVIAQEIADEALGAACSWGHIDIITIMLADKRFNPSCDRNEPIYTACLYGHFSIVHLLLSDKRVNPFDRNNKFLTKLMSDICAEKKDSPKDDYKRVLQILLTHASANPSYNDNYLLNEAIEHGNDEIARAIMSHKYFNPRVGNVLRNACSNGNIDVVKTLLTLGIDPAEKNNEAMIFASENNQYMVMTLLMSDERVRETLPYDLKFTSRKE